MENQAQSVAASNVNAVALKSHVKKDKRHKEHMREKLQIQNFFCKRNMGDSEIVVQ